MDIDVGYDKYFGLFDGLAADIDWTECQGESIPHNVILKSALIMIQKYIHMIKINDIDRCVLVLFLVK